MPRFVLLYHNCPPAFERPSHWDLMLESGDVLRTWALAQLPRDWHEVHSRTITLHTNCLRIAEGHRVVAEQLGDHRRDYLHLEGPLSGNRGTIARVAAGSYRIEAESPDCWRIAFADGELIGPVTLTRLSANGAHWTLECGRRGTTLL